MGLKGNLNPATRPDVRLKMSEAQRKRYAGHKVDSICPWCNKHFSQFLADRIRERRFCSSVCYHAWAKQNVFPKWREAASVTVKCQYCGKEVEVPRSIAETKKFCSMKCRNRWDSEHPNYLLSRLPKPNKVERRLNKLLQEYFPGEWEYTGDGKVILNGLIPDFTNKNGKKAVIELFGDYWHTTRAKSWKDTELGKIMAYKALGFECLVIWEKEVKDEQHIITKVKNFTEAKVLCPHHYC